MVSKESAVKRRSVRKYDMRPLPNDVLQGLKDFLGTIEPPFEGNFWSSILNKEEYDKRSGGMFGVSAPHYLMFFGDKEDDNVLRNVGFAGELAALWLAEAGIGTCWLGGPKSKETLDGSGYIICICFGAPAEALRSSESEFDRKSLGDIASNYDTEQEEILKYVRLAPSARNLQPWFFICETNAIHVFRIKTGGLMSKLALFKMLQKIDIGIAISHFSLTRPFTTEDRPQNEKDMKYECTLKF